MIEKFQKLGINLQGRTSGSIKTLCPSHECRYVRSNKNDKSLSVDITEGVYNCHYCGFKGTVKEVFKMKKEYSIPQVNNTKLSDKTLQWFLDRGISKNTVIRWSVTENREWMPQTGKEENCINFNYYRDGKLVNIKFRDGRKNFKLVKDAELIFYGLDFIKDSEEVYIVEGEIDALSFYEAGIFNVVSVPAGASKGNAKLEYLDNCYTYFENKKKVVLALDNDDPGIALREELARRIGKDKCYIFHYPEDCKDANEILVKGGAESLKICLDYITEFPIEGITSVADVEDKIDYIFNYGFPKGDKIGFLDFDEHISWRAGEMTSITGIPGSGKSEFVDQIVMKLAMQHKWKVAMFSPENQPVEIHFSKLSEKFIGKSFNTPFKEHQMSSEELGEAKHFINESFYFIDINEENVTLDGLLAKVKELVLRKGINGFVLDPWNYIEHKIPYGYTETQYISEALTRLTRFCKTHSIHIFLVAHPTKIQKDQDGKYKVATLYDIAGSAHFFNKTDNGMSVYRDFETGIIDVYIQKIRFKFIGKIGKTSFTWDKHTGKYREHYGIHEGSFVPLPN